MREIKFRAWDSDEKRMVSPDRVDYNGVAWWRENSISTMSKEVMQYTGLKDKNGKEIYEGDICEVTLQMSANEEPEKYIETVEDIRHIPLMFGSSRECEVIGNIYENPELL